MSSLIRLRDSIAIDALIAAAPRGDFAEGELQELARHSPEVLALALLAAGKRVAERQSQVGSRRSRHIHAVRAAAGLR